MPRRILASISVMVLFVSACAGSSPPASTVGTAGGDLPLGDRSVTDKADGDWGHALECKSIPDLPQLVAPQITISLDGLTLHLVDATTGYDEVFPIGPGAIEDDETQPSYRESGSYYPVIATGRHDFSLSPKTADPCRTWWTDPETGKPSPVFAGLPFMPFYGPYAIHGPIDGFRAANGGTLRRGFVSHGCVRLEAAAIVEIYARTKTLDAVAVHLQREPERRADGSRVDLAHRWIGAECASDADCNYDGGLCHPNPYGGRGFCTAHCKSSCADRVGAPTTFCVADPADPSDGAPGICVSRVLPQNPDCRAFGQMVPADRTRRGQPSVGAQVCLPGSRGSIGDLCLADAECRNGATCVGGVPRAFGYCSEPCAVSCPDEPGTATTACASDPVPGASLARGCLRACTAASNASECEGGTTCVPRNEGSKDRRSICRPVQ